MKKKSIFDTGFLLAVFNEYDNFHEQCKTVFDQELANALLPDIVLPELAYLMKRELDLKYLTRFLQIVAKGDFELIRTTEKDLERAAEILEKYDDNNIDFVDTAIVAMAERLDITKILTVDRRHFSVFQPRHCAAFEILP